MKSILLGGCLLGVALTVACGSGTTADEGAGGSSAGANSTGGSSSGGSGAGGSTTGGSASGGGPADGGFCSPGITENGGGVYPYPIDNCGKIAGIADQDAFYRDITLETPIGPGDTYALSATMNSPAGKFELWGATEKCGGLGEKLDTFENTLKGTICLEAKPTTGTYSHLIWVWYVAGEQQDTRFCEGGTCPAK